MDSDQGKLFIGGISWETTEDKLKEYFKRFGEVVEAVIMRDRTTGRARGFGFVVFSDPAVADLVVLDKHSIDGRTVEAKKAVPRDDQQQQSVIRASSNHGTAAAAQPPMQGRTKKIFVGGLASTVTETDFRSYFEQYGKVTDVVVMYDHSTQRPRGFGFITYEVEESVDKVLHKTFHDLNGKMVEVKKAIPKELSPSPASRTPMGLVGGGFGNRAMGMGIGMGMGMGYNSSPTIGGYGMRMDARYAIPSPSPSPGRAGYSTFGSASGYNMGGYGSAMMNQGYVGNGASFGNIGYCTSSYGGLGLGSPSSASAYGGYSGVTTSTNGGGGGYGFSSTPPPPSRSRNNMNLWGNGGGLSFINNNSPNSISYMGGGGGGGLNSYGFGNWGGGGGSLSSPGSAQGGNSNNTSGSHYAHFGHNSENNNSNNGYGSGMISSYGGRNTGYGVGSGTLYGASGGAGIGGGGGSYAEFYASASSSGYGNINWKAATNDELGNSFSGYGFDVGGGSSASQAVLNGSSANAANHSGIAGRSSHKGVAA